MGGASRDLEDEAKLRALIDNTAQGIFNYLKEVSNKREVYEKRCIWELLQNALDAAPQDRRIDVRIIMDEDKLVFTHTGRPFKPEEVAHLIYHGSTKKEFDIGKFGTGFLVTHLISKQVTVRGIREDGKKFEFLLDRSGASASDIETLMEKTWTDYQNSLGTITEDLAYTAEYQYVLDPVSLMTANEGIEALSKIAPYVLAFNDKLGNIEVSNQSHKITFRLVEESNEGLTNSKVVEEAEESNQPRLHEVRMVRNREIEVAIKLQKQIDGTSQVEDLAGVPKIFLGFPLFGTLDLPYPVVINSRKFEPTEKRDGIFLGKEDTDYIKRNKELIQGSNELIVTLLSDMMTRVENIHVLLGLDSPPTKDWLTDIEWYTNFLKKLINDIISLKIVKTDAKEPISLAEAFIPVAEGLEAENTERLWDLFHRLSAYSSKMPPKGLSAIWAEILTKWESLGLDLSSRKITIERLTQVIESSTNIENLRGKLLDGFDEFDLLNDFYRLVIDMEQQGLFDRRSILPTQEGSLVKKPGLLRDGGINDQLKDISAELGKNLRTQLIHSKVDVTVQNLLTTMKEADVLNDIIALIREPKAGDSQYFHANADLLDWLLEHDKLQLLDGLPLLTLDEDKFVTLRNANKEKPLAPKEIWPENSRNYVDLFPKEFVVSSKYLEKIDQRGKWDKLKGEGFILNEPLYTEEEKLSQEDLEFLLLSTEKLDEEMGHESPVVSLSQIAFIGTKDKGLIDTIRKSKERARKFLNFLFDFVIEADSCWSSPLEVDCKCGMKHKIYPSLWIASLKSRSWVPTRKDKSEKPSAQYLAQLLAEDSQLLQKCKQEKPSRLLNVLNVSIGELMMNAIAKDDKIRQELDTAMASLYGTFMLDPSKLTKVAQLAESDPQLFIKEIEERLQTREQIRRNQAVGSLVEDVLRSMIETEGFKVLITGVGSDFAIENDFVKDDKEMIFEIKKEDNTIFYIEVKATVQDHARMTLTQAKEAKDKPDKHVLAVVKLNDAEITEENVKTAVRFVVDIGHKIQDKVSKAEKLQKEEQDIVMQTGDIEIEVTEGPIRFKINKQVWEQGKTFDEFLEAIRAKQVN